MEIIDDSYRYSLHHGPTDTLVENLDNRQIQALCKIIDSSQFVNFQIWVVELNKWFPFVDVAHQVLGGTTHSKVSIPNIDLQPAAAESQHIEIDEFQEENRQHQRYDKEITVLLDINGHLKPLKTLNVSLGGVSLKTKIRIPNRPQYLMMYVMHQGKTVEFKVEPLYISENSFDAIKCLSCNNIEAWKEVLQP